MRGSFQAIPGVLLALFSILVVLGSMALSMVESGRTLTLQEMPTATQPYNEDLGDLIRLVTMTSTLLTTAIPQATLPGVTPSPTSSIVCPHEDNWIAFSVISETNLVEIANNNNLNLDTLRQMNCLTTNHLAAGQILYLPAPTETPSLEPTATPSESRPSTPKKPKKTQVACGAPAGWMIYVVRRGDTLSSLARRLGTTVGQIQSANCMGNSSLIRAGQSLYVPYLPPQGKTPTAIRPSPTRPLALPTNTPLPSPTQPPAPTEPPAPTQTAPPTQLPPTQPPAPTEPPPTQPPPPTQEPKATPLPPTPTDPAPPLPTDPSGAKPTSPPTATPAPGSGLTTFHYPTIPF